MRYMMMVYGEESAWADATEEDAMQAMAEFGAFHEEIAARGNLLIAERLHPSATATSVRVREGRPLITEGPFAETKEQLGGIYVFESKDLDEAIEIAAKIPSAKGGTIEIRPILLGPEETE